MTGTTAGIVGSAGVGWGLTGTGRALCSSAADGGCTSTVAGAVNASVAMASSAGMRHCAAKALRERPFHEHACQLSILPQYTTYAMMKWISTNDDLAEAV